MLWYNSHPTVEKVVAIAKQLEQTRGPPPGRSLSLGCRRLLRGHDFLCQQPVKRAHFGFRSGAGRGRSRRGIWNLFRWLCAIPSVTSPWCMPKNQATQQWTLCPRYNTPQQTCGLM